MGSYKYRNLYDENGNVMCTKLLYVNDADNEFPDCMKCDHMCGSQERCDKCGPEYWWAGYERTEYPDEEENK